jgi:hypothetical protein
MIGIARVAKSTKTLQHAPHEGQKYNVPSALVGYLVALRWVVGQIGTDRIETHLQQRNKRIRVLNNTQPIRDFCHTAKFISRNTLISEHN